MGCIPQISMVYVQKYINSCVSFSYKNPNYTTISKPKNYKANILSYPGRSLYGDRWVAIYAGFYGMDLLLKDGNGGLKLCYGCLGF